MTWAMVSGTVTGIRETAVWPGTIRKVTQRAGAAAEPCRLAGIWIEMGREFTGVRLGREAEQAGLHFGEHP